MLLPERDFWKNMTPHRINLLLEALEPPEKQEEPKSLAAYLSGGT